MRTTKTLALALSAVAIPATASATKPAKDKTKPTKPGHTKPYCTPKVIGFHARGTYVSSDLTQTAGAGTPKTRDDRFSGTLVVDVTKANHKAPKGEQTYQLENARVRVHPRTHAPAAGDRVKVHGKITRLSKKCDAGSFTPTTTVRRVGIKAKKA